VLAHFNMSTANWISDTVASRC